MKGIEISKAYFETYGLTMLKEQFPDMLPLLAAGVTGSGSECFGYDDEVSRDHDFEAGFMLFLPDEDVVDRKTAFRLERALNKLPKEFMGVRKSLMAPVGGARRGVFRTKDYYKEKTGTPDGDMTLGQWLHTPDYVLAEAVNGEIFFDACGEVTAIREKLSTYPEDVRRKKMAGHLLLMAQSGQYNYTRCLMHGETGAAQLAVMEFVKSTMQVLFLLNRRYMPFYKWAFRAMRELPKLSLIAELLEYLITSDNEKELAEDKQAVIEGIAADVIDELKAQGLSEAVCTDLEKHAYSVNDGIENAEIRNMHVFAAT